MNRLVAYLKDTYNELVFKVSWPTKEELSGSTVIVLIASIIIALVVLVMDTVFENTLKFLYGIL